MANPANQREAVLQEHSSLIHLVIMTVAAPENLPQLGQQLELAEANGWTSLVQAVRTIVSGERDIDTFPDLDEEDRIIIESILAGISDPATLPGLVSTVDPDAAGPGIARMIHDIGTGSSGAQQIFDQMIQQLTQAEPELASVAERLNRIVAGERDMGQLGEGLSDIGVVLIRSVLDELMPLEESGKA